MRVANRGIYLSLMAFALSMKQYISLIITHGVCIMMGWLVKMGELEGGILLINEATSPSDPV